MTVVTAFESRFRSVLHSRFRINRNRITNLVVSENSNLAVPTTESGEIKTQYPIRVHGKNKHSQNNTVPRFVTLRQGNESS